MNWPLNKDFAFTIIDDTDNADLQNIVPVYNYLIEKEIKITKTAWIFPSRDKFTGLTIHDEEYLRFLLDLEKKGYGIQLHGVGSGNFTREDIIRGLNIFNEIFNRFPSIHTNHSKNQDNIYWGYKRFGLILSILIKLFMGKERLFYGDDLSSKYFWGDLCKKHIQFIRNRSFMGINTLKYDPEMPYKENKKIFSNYWFSSSDGHTIEEFNKLISKQNIDKLKKQRGLCIVYTHFACGFVDKNGKLNRLFKENVDYLSRQNGWYAPASDILEYLLNKSNKETVSNTYINILDLKFAIHRIWKYIYFHR